MSMNKILSLLTLVLFISLNSYALRYEWRGQNSNNNQAEAKAAACAPATELAFLRYNNVRALIETGGSMWQDRSTSRAFYRIPGEGDVSAIYAGALWLGGFDPANNLKLAAVTFRADGNDFWPGPLTTDGTAEIDEATCEEYDRFFVTERQEAELHRAYFDCLNDDDCEVAEEFPNYIIPASFEDYPAEGNPGLGQDPYLAPFYDYDDDGVYDPTEGDYPWYDFLKEVDCKTKTREDTIPLFGDQNYWWIFNDKGNVHTETNGEPIGMEIRAQAFAFATNDEVNNMTFYNYVLINRGTTTLNDTYFGQWVDADLGTSIDDYVGCDVQRGLGYCYNGDDFDESSGSSNGYGANPPAIGVDFFEGPYQDFDGRDNAGPESILEPLSYEEAVGLDGNENGIPYKGLGIGYGDGIPDNERFGMRKFLYYNIGTGQNGDPETALEYYNYLIGIWKNSLPMTYGGDGFQTGNDASQLADFMFPGDTDNPSTGGVGFGTEGNVREPWSEAGANNQVGDRRFIQSAGPFTLAPGDYNNVTVGVVYGRALSGNSFASVEVLRQADDKAQALFDNCFEIVDGPDAPDLTIQELDEEIILYLSNENTLSNNFRETYGPNLQGFDAGIPVQTSNGTVLSELERSYDFQGYQVYQLANDEVSITDIDNVDLARLIRTIDKDDGITTVVNFEFDQAINEPVPVGKAFGEDSGIVHSISVTQDEFATDNKDLINYKTYYFLAIAYGYNEYEEYNSETGSGQDEVYKASRKSAIGEIRSKAAIPHPISSESNGTSIASNYGDGIALTRVEGIGNGTNIIDLDPALEDQIMSGAPWRVNPTTYAAGGSPVDVKVIDPLAIQSASFDLRLGSNDPNTLDTASWILTINDGLEGIQSQEQIDVLNEQLILDYGISITWQQYLSPLPDESNFREPLESTFEFDDPTAPWLIGFPDSEGFSEFNWIRAGNVETENVDGTTDEVQFDDYTGITVDEDWENVLGGTVAPYCLASYSSESDLGGVLVNVAPTIGDYFGQNFSISAVNNLSSLNNVDIVFTSDKNKWTRVPVLEMQFNENLIQVSPVLSSYQSEGTKMFPRRHPSVDKNGRYVGQEGYNPAEGDFNGSQPEGMGWFPGYAIDQDTGERLNMAFGEDSWLGSENGRDMIWNPTSSFTENFQTYAGGQHWIYVFKNNREAENDPDYIGGYDEGQFMYQNMIVDPEMRDIFRSCTWVASAILTPTFELLSPEEGLIPNDARMRLRVAKEYAKFSATGEDEDTQDSQDLAENFWNPLYTFETTSIQARSEQLDVLGDVLDDINVVPNPYYAFSSYETSKLDNRIKIINLPFECEVNIYDLAGTLIRTYSKADPVTFLDWDLKNDVNIPIASGIYLIHVKTDSGEKILKWFGVMRPVDLDNF